MSNSHKLVALMHIKVEYISDVLCKVTFPEAAIFLKMKHNRVGAFMHMNTNCF